MKRFEFAMTYMIEVELLNFENTVFHSNLKELDLMQYEVHFQSFSQVKAILWEIYLLKLKGFRQVLEE